jgi:hypothetical protein
LSWISCAKTSLESSDLVFSLPPHHRNFGTKQQRLPLDQDLAKKFFGRRAGASPDNSVSFPDFCAVAQAFGTPNRRLTSADFRKVLAETLTAPGPMLFDVLLDEQQGFEPRMTSRRLDDGSIVTPPLEDMFPFLDRNELASNMFDAVNE